MRRKYLMAGLLFAMMAMSAWAAGGASSEPPEGWELYIQPGKAYAIWIPKNNRTLVQSQGTLKINKANVKYTVLECKIKQDVTVNVLVMNLPLKKGDEVDATTVHELLRDLKVKELGGKLAGETDTTVVKLAGKEYRIVLKDRKQVRMRVYFSKPTVYEIAVTGTKKQVEGKTASTVLNSFKHAGIVRRTLLKDQPPPKKKDK